MGDEQEMQQALALAEQAGALDEVPVGARLIRGDQVLGEGFNQNISSSDPTAHAEIVCLREAAKYVSNYRLPGATLYVTLEPCPMCFTALVHARIQRLVYGAEDPKGGFQRFFDPDRLTLFNHHMEIVPNVLAEKAACQIRHFFREKRERGKRKWLKQH